MMTLEQVRIRALEYLDAGALNNAYSSLISDMMKVEGSIEHFSAADMAAGMDPLVQRDAYGMRRWIESVTRPPAISQQG